MTGRGKPRRPGPGGARAGAGRKPLGPVARSVVKTVKLRPDEVAAQEAAAQAESSTWSDWARAALDLAVARGSTR